jgi:hypothetical protein
MEGVEMNLRYCLLPVVLFSLFHVSRNCFGDVATASITVRGKVYKQESTGVAQYPLLGVNVWLLSAENPNRGVLGTGVTDDWGTFYIPSVPPGKYILQFYLVKNLIGQYQITVPSDPSSLQISPQNPSVRFFDIAPVYLSSPARY